MFKRKEKTVKFTLHLYMKGEVNEIREAAKEILGEKYKKSLSIEECIITFLKNEYEELKDCDCDGISVTLDR